MAKQRGYPDRRGMGAQSDFIVQPFVPDESYKAQQRAMMQRLIDAGLPLEKVADMFSMPVDLVSGEDAKLP